MGNYWNTVLEEVLHKSEEGYCFVFTGVKTTPKKVWCIQESKPKQEQTKSTYFLGEKFPDIYFTRREAQVMVNLLKGKTIVSVAATLGISKRTVEFYVKKMREKLHAATKPELLELVNETEFLKNIDFRHDPYFVRVP